MITRPPKDVCGGPELHKLFFKEEDFSDKLHLGCGRNYLEGWTNVDYSRSVKADVYCDLEKPLPFKDNSFDLVYGSHILEHIHKLPELKLELKRIVKFPGCVCFVVPYYLSDDAWGDDTHCRAFSEHSFWSAYWPGFNTIDIKQMPAVEQNTQGKLTWLVGCLGRLQTGCS